MEVGVESLSRVRLRSNAILLFTLDRCTAEMWLMARRPKDPLI